MLLKKIGVAQIGDLGGLVNGMRGREVSTGALSFLGLGGYTLLPFNILTTLYDIVLVMYVSV